MDQSKRRGFAEELAGFVDPVVATRLLAAAQAEWRQLARVRGSARRTWRRRARAAAVLAAVAGLLGAPMTARPARGAAPHFVSPFLLPSNGDTRATPTLADIDGDGDLDAFVGQHYPGNTIFFENTGSSAAAAFASAQTNPFGLSGVGGGSSPELADIDGDGDLDAFVGESSSYSGGNTIFFENTGNSTAAAFATAQTNPFGLSPVGFDSSPALADIDGDGDLDAFVGEFYGNTIFFENTGSSAAAAFASAQTNPFGLSDVGIDSSPALADIDGDGDLDAFVGESGGNTFFFENTGNSTAAAFALAQTNPFGLSDVGSRSSPALADIDGDGDLDTFVGESKGNTIFFENTGSSAAAAFAPTSPFGLSDVVGYYSSPALADIDGDGDLDAFVGESGGNTFFFENTGNSTAAAFATAQTNPFGLSPVGFDSSPALADIDGDGDLDAFVGEFYGKIFFFENTGSSTAAAFAPVQTNPFGLSGVGGGSSPELADIDGDGDLDAFVGEAGGNTIFFENTGSSTAAAFTPALTSPFGLIDVGLDSSPALADIDGDGDIDAFVGERYGRTFFFENTPGACAATPAAGCDTPLRSLLVIKDNNNNTRDVIKFKFIRGTAALGAAFGAPSTTESYALCIYDNGTLVVQSLLPAGAAGWQTIGKAGVGFRYKDKAAAVDGTKKVVLKAGRTGVPKETRVVWIGKGTALPDPVVPVSTPVNMTAQVVGSNGTCFGDTFGPTTVKRNRANSKNTVRTFRAKKP